MREFSLRSLTLAWLSILAGCASLYVAEEPATLPLLCTSAETPWAGMDGGGEDATPSASDPVLHVATYNIHSGMGQWLKAAWLSQATVRKHLDGIAEAIAAVAPE